ncbi:LuxR C-terminal-related transcriptional regulator [Egicoccus sp. AB-alg2]|uniref:LuxR C-terminal-related transcriptional regulator n=1 Tax=Egicoccus sp. AB-alg2 TaxID=3242693 RepID=UPI00359D9ECD
MADASTTLERARAAYRRRDWVTSRAAYREAQRDAALDADDLYSLASCAWWLGDLEEALPAQQQAYRLYLADGRAGAAALVAIDTGYTLMIRGEDAPSSGWIQRAERLLRETPDAPEYGFLVYLDFEANLQTGRLEDALRAAREVQALGRRWEDQTLLAMGVMGEGRVLVKRGDVAAGMVLLDEAMVAAVSDELEPGWAGNIYCHLMEACHELADLRRAGEWTRATARWCEQMPGAGPFMGICRVHRAQVLQVHGAWEEAEREAAHVCDELAAFDVGIVAEAHYQRGELRRQRGDLAGAEEQYHAAHRLGCDPQPGLALLRCAQGRTEAAAASLRAALTAAGEDRLARARLLPAALEVAVAAGDLDTARAAWEELDAAAHTYATTGFVARSHHGRGLLRLAEEDPAGALPALHAALQAWQDLGAPFEAARVRQLLARAYRAMGDADAAGREREAATAGLATLGVRSVDLGTDRAPRGPAALTGREAEVLGLVAAGRSNQQIAAELVLSVRTIERHLATIYQKLGLHGRSARAAAVSYAHREGATRPDRGPAGSA